MWHRRTRSHWSQHTRRLPRTTVSGKQHEHAQNTCIKSSLPRPVQPVTGHCPVLIHQPTLAEGALHLPNTSSSVFSSLTVVTVTNSNYSTPDRGADYCDERVCLSVCVCVCLSTIISLELHVRSSQIFCACYLWPGAESAVYDCLVL